ncbi:MAG: NAD(P)-binding domain-containing protein [Bacteroidota bacterium]|nr:NAD(P)-binding domain-containing protein [Bacteroidota bacterium]
MKKTIGIIGAGNIGKTIATHLLNNGYAVKISNSKQPESLKETVAQLGKGATAVTAAEAAEADMVILAMPWLQAQTLTNLTNWKDKIVVDACNHYISPDFKMADLGNRASSEIVQEHLPGAHVVKAFNTLNFKLLADDPVQENGHRVLFMSGDDNEAKQQVGEMIKNIGFAPIDLGTLSAGRVQQAKGPLALQNLIKL